MKKIIILFAAALLMLTGCAKEQGRDDIGSITVEASIGTMTKVQYENDGTGTKFTAGDKIAVYSWVGSADEVPATRVVDGVVNTLGTDGKWTPESPMLWKSSRDSHYFLGVFPARTITDFKADNYTLDPADYTASDLLVATNLGGVTASDGPVELEFGHAMAKLVVNLKFVKEWETTPSVSDVIVSAKTSAEINYLGNPVVTANGDVSDVGLAALASAPDGYAVSYSGLQVPQAGVCKITVVIGNNEYVYEAANDIPLRSGKYTTLGLAVVGQSLVEVESVTLSDWADGADLPGGAAAIDYGVPISFDPNNQSMASLLVGNPKVNINNDHQITSYEARMVNSLEDLFGDELYNGANYNSFDEFQYFTGITTIPAGSFKNWNNLTSITLPLSITTIEGGDGTADGPFMYCPKLGTIKGKFSVDNKMLVYNRSLLKVAETETSITIHDDIESIGSYAFYKSNVEDITIPSSVKTIYDHAFEYSQLESVTFAMDGTDPATATSYVNSLAENSFVHCFRLKYFNGPTNPASSVWVTSDRLGLCLGTTMYAYAMGSTPTEVIIPESSGIETLAENVFCAKSSNSSTPYPSAVQLTMLTLPSTLTHIGKGAFSAQQAGMEIRFKGENPPVVEDGAFANTSANTITIYVPAVMNGAEVDVDATNARIAKFETAMGMGTGYFKFQYYTGGPVDPYNGHEYVDLGLSVKWATCNVGADNPWDYGDYFAWGETKPKSDYSWDTYFDTSNGGKTFTKYGIGKITVLVAEDDAATSNWGAAWRMPTDEEFEELLALDKQWVENYNGSGINGLTFTGNGNTIFLPAAGAKNGKFCDGYQSTGNYLSSCLKNISENAFCVYFYHADASLDYGYRDRGFSVRPVTK